MALPYPILSCLSRLRSTALRLAPGRTGGAAARRWARGRSRGEGWPLAGGGGSSGGGRSRGAGAQMPFEFPIREVMKILTIISTIFMPLTFIAGVYGMNFKTEVSPWNMPELSWPWGYLFSLLLMASVAMSLLVFFRRKGWL